MDENIEFLEYIYKNAEMGVFTLTKLINDINGKENKIKKLVEEELKGYEKFVKESKDLIKKNKYELKENSKMSKMGASMGIKKEVMNDNSDASLAHMLTQGITMGVVDMETKIKNYKSSLDKKILKLGEDYLQFNQNEIEKLKEYM